MRAVLGAVRLGVAYRFVYRFEVVTAVVAALVVVVINGSLWNAAAGESGELAGLSRSELSTYVVCAWLVSQIAVSNVDQYVGMRFRSGLIAADLTRPMDLQLFATARELGRAAISVVLTAVPVVAAASLLFPVVIPMAPTTWLSAGVSLVLGVLLGAELGFLVGLVTFRTKNIVGLGHLKTTVVALLSGAAVPLDAFPEPMRAVVMALPFQAMAHTPVTLFLGRVEGVEVLLWLGIQLGWVAVFWVACRLVWARMVEHLTVQGG